MQLQARDLTMLYIFEVLESNYFKFGWTERHNAYDRIQNGFWTNIHPEELCYKGDPERPEKLAPSNLNIILLFEGGSNLESVIKSLFFPECGEFWRKEELINMVDMLLLMTEQVSLPTRPRFQNTVNLEKLACCTGHWHVCFKCGQKFKRFDKLMQHKRDKHEAARFKCICGKDFPRKGNLDRHVLNSCKKRA